jgi:hypothetical protein
MFWRMKKWSRTRTFSFGAISRKGRKSRARVPVALNPGPPIDEPKGVLFVPKRRKALALWLTSPENPLLARVMVNRLWQGHFGKGIVTTPNDFGRQGEAPSHPELLDWLAVEFAQQGYSIKQMHRMIMLSNTYRASSVADPVSLEKDPENRYLSRMNRRRLDGDAIRDTTLAVAGNLNLKMGGVGVIPPLTKEEILAARMPKLWPANPDPTEHARRSIYLQMKRSLTLPMLQIFDAPDTATAAPVEKVRRRPAGAGADEQRVHVRGSRAVCRPYTKQAGENPEASVEAGWRLAFGRAPSDKERLTALDYLRRNSLPRLCLLMFNMSEFIYVD